MKKVILSTSVILLAATGAFAQTTGANPTSTPYAIPTTRHNPEFHIKKHMAHQYQQIRAALASNLISKDQAKNLNIQVTAIYKKIKADYAQNAKTHLTPAQETEIYQMLNSSRQAIEAAINTGTNTTTPVTSN